MSLLDFLSSVATVVESIPDEEYQAWRYALSATADNVSASVTTYFDGMPASYWSTIFD
jgi:hypothetical protein